MKILYHISTLKGIQDTYEGYKYAFKDKGHQFFTLTNNDDLDSVLWEIQPDIFITSLNLIKNFSVLYNARKFRLYNTPKNKMKTFMGLVGYDFFEIMVDLIAGGRIGDVFFDYFPPEYYKNFKEITHCEYQQILLAANRKYHYPTKPVEKYKCDIVFLGANLPKKRDLFKRRLYPLFKKYDVRIYGTGWTLSDRYLLRPLRKLGLEVYPRTFIPLEDENKVYSSAKICLNLHEVEDTICVNGRTFRIPACGGFEICDYVPEIREFFNEDELIMAKTDKEWFETIDYYMTHEKERKAIQEKGTFRALKDHTYHNRIEKFL